MRESTSGRVRRVPLSCLSGCYHTTKECLPIRVLSTLAKESKSAIWFEPEPVEGESESGSFVQQLRSTQLGIDVGTNQLSILLEHIAD